MTKSARLLSKIWFKKWLFYILTIIPIINFYAIYEQMYKILLYIIEKHLKDQWKDSLDTLKTKWSQLISLVTHILPFLMLRPESNSLQHLWSLLLGNDKLFINETDMIMKFITLTRSSNFLLKILSLIFQVRQWNGILQPCNWFDCLYAIKRQIKTISRSVSIKSQLIYCFLEFDRETYQIESW